MSELIPIRYPNIPNNCRYAMSFLNGDPNIAIVQLSLSTIPNQEYIIRQNQLQKGPINTLQAFHWKGPREGTDITIYEFIELRRFLEAQPYLLNTEPDFLEKYLTAFTGCILCNKCSLHLWFCDPVHLYFKTSPDLFIAPIIYPGSESITTLEFSNE